METIEDAINYWQALADHKARFAQAVQAYDQEFTTEAAKQSLEAANVAQALRMQRDTGIVYCPCKTPPHPHL